MSPDTPKPNRPPTAPLAPPASAAVTPVALEQERERVVQALSTHYAYDRLSLSAVEERLERAYRATTPAELHALLADLPAATAEAMAAAAPLPLPLPVAATVPERGFALAIFGGFERKGGMAVPRHFKVTAVMGGGVLDLREARFGAGVTELELFVLMGGVEVLVPPGVRVECSGAAIMGGLGTDTDEPTAASPDQPVLRLNGFVIWGGVDVQTRFPGESEKQYKRRRKEERRRRG
jgi:hypothetical protein